MKRTVLLAFATIHPGVYRGAARYAKEHEWHLVTDMVTAHVLPHEWKGDGILSHVGYWNELAEFLLRCEVPKVDLSWMGARQGLPTIQANHSDMGKMAAHFFLERSYQNVAWAPFVTDDVNEERYNGLRSTLEEQQQHCHVLPPQHKVTGTPPALHWANNCEAIEHVLTLLPKPLGIYCYNDCVAANLLGICDDAGFRVPEEVAILGTDNDTRLCESVRVPLSSLTHTFEEMGYQAAAHLDQLMDGSSSSSTLPQVEPTGIQQRASTPQQAVKNIGVALALTFIRAHYRDPHLAVDNVVAATPLSRRPLEIAFKREMGRTILEEITQQRLDHVCEQLCSTEDPVTQIALDSGFRRTNHLFRTFRNHFGTSPQQFRAHNGEVRDPPE